MIRDDSDLAASWTAIGRELVRAPRASVHGLIPHDVAEFLSTTGMPIDAAPYISFSGLENVTVESWRRIRDRRYLIIGSDGAGDLISLDVDGGCAVQLLAHDDESAAPRFMARSIRQLGWMLLAYAAFIQRCNAELDAGAYVDGRAPEDAMTGLRNELLEIDADGLSRESFWARDLGQFVVVRPISDKAAG